MTPREIVLEQIHHRETARIPYSLGRLSNPGERFSEWAESVGADAAHEEEVGVRLDEYFGGDAWRGRLIQYIAQCGNVARDPNERLDAIHQRDAFGTVWRRDKLPPSVVEPGLKAPSFQGYAFPPPETFLDAALKADAMKRVGESSDSFTIISPGLCLWQSWYVRGFETTLMDCVAEEAFYTELLDRFTDLTLALVEACADVPADAIMMGDDWGSQRGVTIGPERWRTLFKPRYARIFETIHAQGKLAIMHSCGSVAEIMGDLIEIGLDVLESVQPEAAGMNPYELKRAWGDQITFWGGLGSQSTVPFATPAEIRREIQRLRSEMSRGGGYILAPAKPLRSETPTANAVAVVEEFLAG